VDCEANTVVDGGARVELEELDLETVEVTDDLVELCSVDDTTENVEENLAESELVVLVEIEAVVFGNSADDEVEMVSVITPVKYILELVNEANEAFVGTDSDVAVALGGMPVELAMAVTNTLVELKGVRGRLRDETFPVDDGIEMAAELEFDTKADAVVIVDRFDSAEDEEGNAPPLFVAVITARGVELLVTGEDAYPCEIVVEDAFDDK
jgi:hypothetical protein